MSATARHPNPTPLPFEQRMAAAVSTKVGPARFALWFQGHARFVGRGAEVVVARNPQSRDWLADAFGDAVAKAAAEVSGRPVAVTWAEDEGLFGEQGADDEEAGGAGPGGTGGSPAGAGEPSEAGVLWPVGPRFSHGS